MGKVYRRKRRSCPLCKPQKTGHAPADTDRQRMETRIAQLEAELALRKDYSSEVREQSLEIRRLNNELKRKESV